MKYQTKDSGKREEYASGMLRDTTEGKPRYDLIPHEPLKRLAELYARGAIKYGDNNWQLANSEEELARFKASAARHFHQWMNDEQDEDHGIGATWNIFAHETIKEKLQEKGDQIPADVFMSTHAIFEDLADKTND